MYPPCHGDKIYYTKEFYRAMYDCRFIAGRALWMPMHPWGFNVRELGEDRGNLRQRGAAEQMSENRICEDDGL